MMVIFQKQIYIRKIRSCQRRNWINASIDCKNAIDNKKSNITSNDLINNDSQLIK